MSSTASNYDMGKLVAGQAVTLLSVFLAMYYSFPIFGQSPLASTVFALITLTYGTMMFASSYIEEEHNFWYWAASGWITILIFKKYALSNNPDIHNVN